MLPKIQSLWIGSELSKIEYLTIQSYLYNGHDFLLYTYGEVANVPSGTIIMDANDIIPSSEIFTSHGSYAHFSDWFRWKLISLTGDFWVDMDEVCIRPFDFDSPIVFGEESDGQPNVSVIRFPVGHPLTLYMIDRCENPNTIRDDDSIPDIMRKYVRRYIFSNDKSRVKWGEAGGPTGFLKALEKFDLLNEVLPVHVFYPVKYKDCMAMLDRSESESGIMIHNETRGVHLWNTFFYKNSVDKNHYYHPDSFLEGLRSKYHC